MISVPPIKKCSLSDSDCIKDSAQPSVSVFATGIPEIGTEALDPLQIDSIKVDLSGLKLNIKDVVIKGLKKAIIEKLRLVDFHLFFQVFWSEVSICLKQALRDRI